MLLEDTTYLKRDASTLTWEHFLAARWDALEKNKELRTKAVIFLQRYFERELSVLNTFVVSNPAFPSSFTPLPCSCGSRRRCPSCNGVGYVATSMERIGLDLEIRNALRANGFSEEAWPVWNLEDYYPALILAACRGENAIKPLSAFIIPKKPKPSGWASISAADDFTIRYAGDNVNAVPNVDQVALANLVNGYMVRNNNDNNNNG